MVLGALGATWAHSTGVEEAAAIRYVGESTAAAVQEHKGVSDLMLVASWIAAVAAAAVFFSNLIPGVSLLARLVAVIQGVVEHLLDVLLRNGRPGFRQPPERLVRALGERGELLPVVQLRHVEDVEEEHGVVGHRRPAALGRRL
jgi:hypothetical protein